MKSIPPVQSENRDCQKEDNFYYCLQTRALTCCRMSCNDTQSDDDTCQCDIIPVVVFPPRRCNSQASSAGSISSCQSRNSDNCDETPRGKTCGKPSSCGKGGHGGSDSKKCGSRGAKSKCGGPCGSPPKRRCDTSRSQQRNNSSGCPKRSSSQCNKSPSSTCGNRSCGKSRDAGAVCSGKKSKTGLHRSRAANKSCPASKDEKCDLCSKMSRSCSRKPSKCGSKDVRNAGKKNAPCCKNKRKQRDNSSCSRKDKRQTGQCEEEKEMSCPDDDDEEEEEDEEEGESSTSEDLCPRCQQELSRGAGAGCPPFPSTRSSKSSMRSSGSACFNLKSESTRDSSCCSGATRPSSGVSGGRSASCDSVGNQSSSSCNACTGGKSEDSGLIVDLNCPVHGLEASAAKQQEKKQDTCGQPACQNKAQVRFSDETITHSTGCGPGNKLSTPQGEGARCSRSQSRSQVNRTESRNRKLFSAQCPVGEYACTKNTAGPPCATGKPSRCSNSSTNTLACSTHNFTDSKLKFDFVFSNIYETLSNEMYRIQTDPCISCCVPKYVTRGQSRSRRNILPKAGQVNVVPDAGQCNDVKEEATCGCEGGGKKKPTPCENKDQSPACPDKDKCGKTC